jgi:hypothetical protein
MIKKSFFSSTSQWTMTLYLKFSTKGVWYGIHLKLIMIEWLLIMKNACQKCGLLYAWMANALASMLSWFSADRYRGWSL